MARLSPKIPADLDHLPDCYATTHDLVENVKIIQKFQDIFKHIVETSFQLQQCAATNPFQNNVLTYFLV